MLRWSNKTNASQFKITHQASTAAAVGNHGREKKGFVVEVTDGGRRYRSCVGLFLGSTLSISSIIDQMLIGTILIIQHFPVWIEFAVHIEDDH